MKIHIVQKGDTLWKIAKKYGVNFEELKKMNSQLSNPDMIMPGMKVKVPTTGGMVKKEAPTGTKSGAPINQGIKKEMPIAEHPFAKEQPKPMPIVEAPIKEAPIKEVPIKEVPIKEAPIKEAPKAPYTPKMPTPVVPEIDINNYYMMNMANMTVQQPPPQLPPKPVNVLPEIKEVPKKEIPVVEAPLPVVEQPVCEPECVPVTPVMPGSGLCPPLGYPQVPVMPYAEVPGAMPIMPVPMPYAEVPGAMPIMPVPMPTDPGMMPAVGGAAFMPTHFEDESSSLPFMPNMPIMNPGGQFGGTVPATGFPVQTPYMQPGAVPGGQMPAGVYQGISAPGGYPGYPEGPEVYQTEAYTSNPAGGGYPGNPGVPEVYQTGGYPGNPGVPGGYQTGTYPGYHEVPAGYQTGVYQGTQETPVSYQTGAYQGYPAGAYPAYTGYPEMQGGYPGGTYPSTMRAYPEGGYPSQPGPWNQYQNPGMVPAYGTPAAFYPPGQMPYGYPQMGPAHVEYESSDILQGTGVQPGSLPVATGGFADCGCGAPSPVPQQAYVPTTPPVYMAPYTAPVQVAQPPFMNPYGMGPMGAAPYGMPRDADENDESGIY